ncbi:hypothetical protein [Ornithinimicrobium sufpigmenti]|uniref:hypothetical protein n=1 Tax=Ornithinimicrobium sufpigmenti TaxID=2508882 RepID=UPI0010359EEC|nr:MULTISPECIES: hypothetical protein [unclassified Ornithinimicrobium]
MSKREIKIVLTDVDDDGYAEVANAAWMLLQVTSREGHIEHDGKTAAADLDAWWQSAVDERHWD